MSKSLKMYVLCERQYKYNDEIDYSDSVKCQLVFTNHEKAKEEAIRRSFNYIIDHHQGQLKHFYYEPSEWFKSIDDYQKHRDEGLIGVETENSDISEDKVSLDMPLENWTRIYDNMIFPCYFVQETVVDTSELLE